MKIVFIDTDKTYQSLLPICFTRPLASVLTGIFPTWQRWCYLLQTPTSTAQVDFITAEWLRPNKSSISDSDADTLYIYSHWLPTPQAAKAIMALTDGDTLTNCDGQTIAYIGNRSGNTFSLPNNIKCLSRPYDIFQNIGNGITLDFDLITQGQKSQTIPASCTVIGPRDRIYIEDNVWMEGVTLNTTNGPIRIGNGATIMEGSCLRGPINIGNGATVNMLTRIYGPTSIGEGCKVGGEINNVVMHAYSNKAHDGFLGNAVIGSWCNLGAGCVASNLKNDYSPIRLWNYDTHRFDRTSLQFCGLVMGDHSKAGINTMFNTATVVGVGCNIHGTGFPRNFIPSFSDGSPLSGYGRTPLKQFLSLAEKVMARRNVTLSPEYADMMEQIYLLTESY